jgi:hypothetical protein
MSETHPVIDRYLTQPNESLSTLQQRIDRRSSMTFAATLPKRRPAGDRSRARSRHSDRPMPWVAPIPWN